MENNLKFSKIVPAYHRKEYPAPPDMEMPARLKKSLASNFLNRKQLFSLRPPREIALPWSETIYGAAKCHGTNLWPVICNSPIALAVPHATALAL